MNRLYVLNPISLFLGVHVVFFFVLFIGLTYIFRESHERPVDPSDLSFLILLFGIGLVILSAIFGKMYFSIERVIFNLSNQPLLYTSAATQGDSFVGHGTIESSKPLIAPLSKNKCALYTCRVWTSILSERHATAYFGESIDNAKFVDSRGELKIDFSNVDSDHKKNPLFFLANTERKNYPYSEVLTEKSFDLDEINTKKRLGEIPQVIQNHGIQTEEKLKRHYIENILPLGKNFTVFGHIEKRDGELILVEGKNSPLIVSQNSPQFFLQNFKKGRSFLYTLPLTFLVGISTIAVYLLVIGLLNFTMTSTIIMFCLALYPLIVGLFVYNRIVLEDNRTQNAVSNLSGELKRREDLISNLEKVAKAHGIYEQTTLEKVLTPRIDISHKQQIGEVQFTLNSASSLKENFPNLTSDKAFAELAHHLNEAESRIMDMRNFYNENVTSYNEYIGYFPHNYLARYTGFISKEFIDFTKFQ